MSIPVDPKQIAGALADFGTGYLLTVSPEGRVKAVTVEPTASAEALVVDGVSRGSARNISGNPQVTVLFPPAMDPKTHKLSHIALFFRPQDVQPSLQNPLVDTYLSRDGRLALIDVFPADSTSLTTSMDLVKRARALGQSLPSSAGKSWSGSMKPSAQTCVPPMPPA